MFEEHIERVFRAVSAFTIMWRYGRTAKEALSIVLTELWNGDI